MFSAIHVKCLGLHTEDSVSALQLWLTSVTAQCVNQWQRFSVTHSHFKSTAASQASFPSAVGSTTSNYTQIISTVI